MLRRGRGGELERAMRRVAELQGRVKELHELEIAAEHGRSGGWWHTAASLRLLREERMAELEDAIRAYKANFEDARSIRLILCARDLGEELIESVWLRLGTGKWAGVPPAAFPRYAARLMVYAWSGGDWRQDEAHNAAAEV